MAMRLFTLQNLVQCSERWAPPSKYMVSLKCNMEAFVRNVCKETNIKVVLGMTLSK